MACIVRMGKTAKFNFRLMKDANAFRADESRSRKRRYPFDPAIRELMESTLSIAEVSELLKISRIDVLHLRELTKVLVGHQTRITAQSVSDLLSSKVTGG